MSRMEERIADKYRAQGFDVILDPELTQMPFPMGNYRPDLIATKGQEKLIVDVVSRFATLTVERFQEVNREVRSHPGWKLVIVNLSEEDSFVAEAAHLVPEDLFGEALLLAQSETPKYAVIPAWNAYEVFLRREADTMPDYTSAGSLLASLVTLGLISNDHFEAARRLNQIRNQVIHGVGPQPGREEVFHYIETARGLTADQIERPVGDATA